MILLASLLAGCRRAALLFALVAVALLAPASAAQAQRLLTLVSGTAEAASVGGLGPSIGPVPTAVQVDLDLLRGAPARLEVPTPDGSVLSAERSVFEDRGGGDLMWSGGQPDAGYDTVLLTVEGGRLVGRFGAAGGGVYQIHAERDGRGGMMPVVGQGVDGSEPWCGVEVGAEDAHDLHAHGQVGAHAADLPEPVSNPESHDRLDILVAYTATAAENWADRGGAVAAIRHAGDYLKMVFRNNRIEVEPHIVHITRASATLDRVGRDVGHHEWKGWSRRKLLRVHMNLDRELWRLRLEHRADMVYLFVGENAHLLDYLCGSYDLLDNDDLNRDGEPNAYRPDGWSTNDPSFCGDYAAVFVHELGHGLGAHHDPAHVAPFLHPDPSAVLGELFRPYALGYVNYDVMPSLGTAMSYEGQIEPFFSSARIRPYGGAAIGIGGEQDNERLLRETAPIVVRSSDYLRSLEGLPAQPSNLRARFEGAFAHLSWQDNAPDADGYYVTHRQSWGEDNHAWDWRRVGGRTEAVLPLEVTVPGARHEFSLQARKGDAYSLASTTVALVFPGDPIKAPSDVSVSVSRDLGAVEVRWADNSENETGFDAQLLLGGEPIRRQRVPADSTNARFGASGRAARPGAEYGVRVFAFNSSDESESSETVTFRWEHPLMIEPVEASASAIDPTTVRVTWTFDPEVAFYRVSAVLRGWEDARRWYPPDDGPIGAAWMDFEGLARGGRYEFVVSAVRPFGLPSGAYLTLGDRAAGPLAPSGLSMVTEDGQIHVTWNDNSSDELGFEIQVGILHPDNNIGDRQSWWRGAIVPPETESAVFSLPLNLSEFLVRVFAYNERGFSFSSPLVFQGATGSCQADPETLCLQDSRFAVKVNWWNGNGESGVGRIVEAGTDESGMFQFFDADNWEILIKVLNGCGINGRMWVLGASTTDLGYRIVVTDTVTGESRSYENEPGQPAPAIVDTEAFPEPCVDGAGP